MPSSNGVPRIRPNTLQKLRIAAAFDAWGGRISDAARAMNMRPNSLQKLCRDHCTSYEKLYAEASERPGLKVLGELAGEAELRAIQQRRVSRRTWQRIRKACAMLVGGASRAEVGEAIGVAVGTITNYQQVYRNLWQAELDQAMETSLQIIRRQAGTDTVLKDVKTYLRRALKCERWAQANNRPLFENSEEVTLRSFYETYYRPLRLEDASPRGIADYRTTLRHWALLTGDPPLKQITSELLMRFRDCLRQAGGRGGRGTMANNSIRKHLGNVQVLLDKCGQPERGNRDAAGLLERPPWVKPPRKEYPAVRTVSMEQVGRVYLAADRARLPQLQDVSPAAWWRALLVMAWNTGLRKRNLLEMRFDQIDWAQCRVEIPAKKHKTRRGQSLHLNRAALEHLCGIRTDRELVFPWTGNRLLGPGGDSSFHRTFRRLQLAAGLKEKELFGLHDLRRTVATTLWEHSPQAASLQLGHTDLATTRRHYVEAGPIIARALDALPQPAVFQTDSQPA